MQNFKPYSAVKGIARVKKPPSTNLLSELFAPNRSPSTPTDPPTDSNNGEADATKTSADTSTDAPAVQSVYVPRAAYRDLMNRHERLARRIKPNT